MKRAMGAGRRCIIIITILTEKGGNSYACLLYLTRSIRNSQFVYD
jgi:hypothetical protein